MVNFNPIDDAAMYWSRGAIDVYNNLDATMDWSRGAIDVYNNLDVVMDWSRGATYVYNNLDTAMDWSRGTIDVYLLHLTITHHHYHIYLFIYSLYHSCGLGYVWVYKQEDATAMVAIINTIVNMVHIWEQENYILC